MAGQFIKSATELGQCPISSLDEVAIVGRSNSGKSTLINAMAKQKNLARVSSRPGKTDLLNFYEIDGKFMLTDMPGYGYAARSQDVKETWTPMIEEYLQHRARLKGVILLVDAKRSWTRDENNLVDWLSQYGHKTILVLTKIDKLNQKEMSAKRRHFLEVAGVQGHIFVSAAKGAGIEELNRTVFEKLIRS